MFHSDSSLQNGLRFWAGRQEDRCPGGRCGLTCGRRVHALSQQHPILDIPGSTVEENLPASVGDMGSIPGPGRSQHTKEQLSLCTPTTKRVLCNERNHHNGKFMHPN